jgi:nucleotide-binding universal stress UspA family protein
VAAALFPGADVARAAGPHATPTVLFSARGGPEHEGRRARLRHARRRTGRPGAARLDGVKLLHHAALPMLVVPAGAADVDGPLFAGYDGSEGALKALRFAAVHLSARRLIVAHAWHSPVRHSLRGHVLAHSGIDTLEDYAETLDTIWSEIVDETADERAAFARELGLTAESAAPESGNGDWQTLLEGARAVGAAAILVGTRGRGAVASTVLGSVASGLVHAAPCRCSWSRPPT